MRRIAGIATLLAALAAAAAPAHAGDRENPFAPPLSREEDLARQRELARAVVREMIPEIEANATGRMSSQLSELEVRLERRIEEAGRMAAASPQPGLPDGSGVPGAPLPPGTPGVPGAPGDPNAPAAAGNGLPEGSTFISCVNGKALYRDKDNSLFQVSGNGTPGVHRCAR